MRVGRLFVLYVLSREVRCVGDDSHPPCPVIICIHRTSHDYFVTHHDGFNNPVVLYMSKCLSALIIYSDCPDKY